jgi:hypothetical protein
MGISQVRAGLAVRHGGTQIDGQMIIIVRMWLCDDVDSLYVKIDKLNNLLVGFYFIRSIDNSGRLCDSQKKISSGLCDSKKRSDSENFGANIKETNQPKLFYLFCIIKQGDNI